MEAPPIHRQSHLRGNLGCRVSSTEVFTLAPFSPPGLYSGLGTQTTAKGAEDAELGQSPSSEGGWCVSLCPDSLVPLLPGQEERTETYPKSDGQCPAGTCRDGCIRRVPKPVSQQNGQVWGPRVLPQLALLPPPTGGGKINTEFTKSGPSLAQPQKKSSSQSNRNQPGLPGTLLLPCPRGLGSPLQQGPPGQKGADSVSY